MVSYLVSDLMSFALKYLIQIHHLELDLRSRDLNLESRNLDLDLDLDLDLELKCPYVNHSRIGRI